MEASNSKGEVEVENGTAGAQTQSNVVPQVVWKVETNPDDHNDPENPTEESAPLSDEDDDDGDEDDSEPEAEMYETGYIQVDPVSGEPPAKKSAYQFELDPRTRKRQCKRILQRLKLILDELSARVGQQVAIIVAQPPNASVKTINTYGSAPLQDVIKRYHPTILEYLSEALAQREPQKQVDPSRFDLPQLIMEGTPTPLDKMTQAQLREFIPLMIRYSTGRGKPGWGLDRTRPPWWPLDIPWQNIRLDPRDAESKARESWSDTLRRIIIACYKFHDREDLLLEASGSYEEPAGPSAHIEESSDSSQPTLVQVKTNNSPEQQITESVDLTSQGAVSYGQVVNPDGTISLFLPKTAGETETRQVILMDADGREYHVQIAVPSSQASVLGNFQVGQSVQAQGISTVTGQIIGLSN